MRRYGLLMSGGFVFEVYGLVFLLHDSGWKRGLFCFILGNCPPGFRDEREIYH